MLEKRARDEKRMEMFMRSRAHGGMKIRESDTRTSRDREGADTVSGETRLFSREIVAEAVVLRGRSADNGNASNTHHHAGYISHLWYLAFARTRV